MELYHFSEKFFGEIGLSGFWCKVQKNLFSTKSPNTSAKLSIETLMGEIKPIVTEMRQFECRHEKNSKNFSDFSDYQDSDAESEADDFSGELFATSWEFSL